MDFRLTDSQKDWIWTRKLKIDGWYSMPDGDFTVYETINGKGEWITIEAGKTIAHNSFVVKEIHPFVVGGYVAQLPHHYFYINRVDLEMRPIAISIFLLFTCYLPFIFKNWLKKQK